MRELLKEEPPFNLLLQTGQVIGWRGFATRRQARVQWRQAHPLAQLVVARADAVDWSQLPLLVSPLQVLLAQKQWQEARELLQAALDVCGKRCGGGRAART